MGLTNGSWYEPLEKVWGLLEDAIALREIGFTSLDEDSTLGPDEDALASYLVKFVTRYNTRCLLAGWGYMYTLPMRFGSWRTMAASCEGSSWH